MTSIETEIEKQLPSLFDGEMIPGQLAFPEDDMSGEAREYKLRGLLTADRWELALELFTSLGIRAEQLEIEASPVNAEINDDDPRTILSRNDFFDLATKHEIRQTTAGRAWTALARIFDAKVRPKSNSRRLGYNQEDYQHVPDGLFVDYPPDSEDPIYSRDLKEEYSGIRLSKLDELLHLVVVEKYQLGLESALHKVFGRSFGPKSYDFLVNLSAEKHAEIERPKLSET
jgi:hypothetical protein